MVYKDVIGLENFYKINSAGKIINKKTGKEIVPRISDGGFKVVTIYETKKDIRTKHVHRLVSECFLPNYLPRKKVHFIDGDKWNIDVVNLEQKVENAKAEIHQYQGKRRGVYKHKLSGRYWSNITINYTSIYLGMFDDKEDAYKAFYDKHIELKGFKPW